MLKFLRKIQKQSKNWHGVQYPLKVISLGDTLYLITSSYICFVIWVCIISLLIKIKNRDSEFFNIIKKKRKKTWLTRSCPAVSHVFNRCTSPSIVRSALKNAALEKKSFDHFVVCAPCFIDISFKFNFIDLKRESAIFFPGRGFRNNYSQTTDITAVV